MHTSTRTPTCPYREILVCNGRRSFHIERGLGSGFSILEAHSPYVYNGGTVELVLTSFFPAEDDYLLHDENNEKKYHFKLADALRRARTVGWKLFDKKVFYVTPKVPVDIKILKNVVTAGGGQVCRSLYLPNSL